MAETFRDYIDRARCMNIAERRAFEATITERERDYMHAHVIRTRQLTTQFGAQASAQEDANGL